MDDSFLLVLLVTAAFFAVGLLIAKLRKGSNTELEETPHIFEGQAEAPSVPPTHPPVQLSELLPAQFVVLDLETTGLNAEIDEIIEVGAIRVTVDAQNHQTFQTLVKPIRKVPPQITNITGITQKMVDDEGIPLDRALVLFKEFVADLPIVTFNAEFDMGFLHNAARRHGISFPNPYTCALKRARRAWPELPSHRLVDLARWGSLPDTDSHRALGDCMRALFVFTSATSKLGQKVRWTKPAVFSE